ncbi:uncharacterized protein LOC128652832 [Bombina bombina]|uniref:uncharacterized protein LOC128652832 n=1 Tax=Bombina bombina TaxID=8345 RepID=UPI00235AB832|nr:uncharacterized protein LOC128652832 [Bombina bombina]
MYLPFLLYKISLTMGGIKEDFLWVMALCALAETRYVRVGSDVSFCGLRCPNLYGVLELYCKPRTPLLALHCDDNYTNVRDNFINRLDLNISSGCCVLREAQKEDTCVYEIEFHSSPTRILRSTPITVIEPVVISNITSNSSEPGSDISLHVLFSGEETTVTWEMDSEDVPARYQLRDQNRTLIIPSAQREDAGKRFMVRVTNPVSEGTWEHVLEIRGDSEHLESHFSRRLGTLCAAVFCVVLCTSCFLYQFYINHRRSGGNTGAQV